MFDTAQLKLENATMADAGAIAALRLAVARELTARYGRGTWSHVVESEGGVRVDILTSRILVARCEGTVVATLRLSPRSPWIGEIDYFTPRTIPIFLTSMAVMPKLQRCGIGRACLDQVKRIGAEWPADAIRLDAYDAPAGAGDFYRRCGFREARRASYNGTPLIFFEYLINLPAAVTRPTPASTG